MGLTFNKNGISEGNIIQPSHITQSYDAFTSQVAYDITISGSLILTGSVESYNGFTGSFTGSLNGDFIGYDTNVSPVSIKVGFINATLTVGGTATISPTFPGLNNIINMIFTVTPSVSPINPNDLDWYPVVSATTSTSWLITSSKSISLTYTFPITVTATIFYN